MLANVKSVWPVIVGCDLNRKPHAIANILNKRVARPAITLSNLVRKDQFRVRVDAAPQPKIAALCLVVLSEVCLRDADILPLFIHLDSDARQITKVSVHVICERFAGFTNDTLESCSCLVLNMRAHGANRRPFAERH